MSVSNLQRQTLHSDATVGQPKVESARTALARINPNVQFTLIDAMLDDDALFAHIARHDLVLDCTDNFHTRQAINRACVTHHKPLVSGAVIQFDGQVAVYDLRHTESPCYACVFPPDAAFEEARCATMGVFAPLVGIIGALQAAEALKLLAEVGTSLAGRLLMLDGRTMEWSAMQVARDSACNVCSFSHNNHKLRDKPKL